jgi:transcriptional regulator with XRE-family HTH domain
MQNISLVREAFVTTLDEFQIDHGQRLRVARLRLGLSQEKAAELAGVWQTNWSKLENGRTGVSLEHLFKLAVAIGADPHALDDRLAEKPAGNVCTLLLTTDQGFVGDTPTDDDMIRSLVPDPRPKQSTLRQLLLMAAKAEICVVIRTDKLPLEPKEDGTCPMIRAE